MAEIIILWIVIAIIYGIVKTIREKKAERLREEAERSMERKVINGVEMHIDTLVRKRAQTLKTDDYGNILPQKWQKEKKYFLSKVIIPTLNQNEQTILNDELNWVLNVIVEKRVRAAHIEKNQKIKFDESMSGREFELFCANELKKAGWKVQVTKSSGDQGVDIVAKKNNMRVVFQCKKHANPVSNKAVQEIFSGKTNEGVDAACVVSSSSYTKSAQELAKTTGVYLLHYLDLKDIDKIIRGNPH